MSMNERSDRDFRERRDVMISREIPLNQELLASFSGRGRRRLRDLKQATETVLKLDRAKSCLQVRGTERSIADLRRHLETLIGHRRCVSAGAWAELMRTRTVIDSSEAAIQHIQEESGCRVHIERTTQEVRLYGPEQSLKVADRLLKELTEETDVQQVEGMLSPELLEQVALRQGVTLRMRETCIEVLGRKAATRAAAAELEKLIKDPTTKTEHVGISAHVGVRSQSPKSFEAPLRVKSSRPDRQGSNQVIFLPMSGLMGDNIKEKKGTPSWYEGPTLLDALDGITVLRKAEGPVRIPMMEGYKDMGAVTAIGKVEQGTIKPGMKCIVMPTYNKCTVTSVFINDVDMQYATCGENVTLKMSGISDEELKKGYVLCADKTPIPVVSKFKATIHVIELGPDRPVMTSGYVAVMHAHTASEECEILKLYETMVIQTKKKEKNPQFARPDSVVVCSIKLARPTAVDTFQSSQQLGRFTLRVDGRTIAIGKITELPKTATENA